MFEGQKDDSTSTPPINPLKEAVRDARIEAAERSGVVVDLRDADVARLELLNDALDPVFKDVPGDVELFDRAVSKGDVPRLWIDVVAHVEMGRDKRQYRFMQDTRYGRVILAESYEVLALVQAITRYVARRMVEREGVLSDDAMRGAAQSVLRRAQNKRRWRAVRTFIYGLIAGVVVLFALAMLSGPHS